MSGDRDSTFKEDVTINNSKELVKMEKGKADRGPGITARLWDSSLIQNSASESLQIGQRSEMKGSITMKKLMIAASAALCATVSFAELASANVVGYANKSVTAGDRAMRTAATFLNVGANPTEIKISDIKQSAGDPGDLTLSTYDDNVTRLAQYWFFSTEATGGELPEGWYLLNSDMEPEFDKGTQNIDLPYGQGCVIVSGNSSATYTSAGEVDSIKREFSVTAGARKMMGNVLPKSVQLSEIKQTVGDPGDLTFCTYDNNVTRQAQYWYFSTEATGGEIPEGWYLLNSDMEPEFDKGIQDFEIGSGEGFVVVSGNSNAVLQFPKAM